MSRWVLVALCLGLFLGVLGAAPNPYLVRTIQDPSGSGKTIDQITVPDVPVNMRHPGPVAVPNRTTIMLANVPAFDWSYGCSATSAAMMAGYYDRRTYCHDYAGPTNNGIMPLDNSTWGAGECPLSATHQGYDGRTTAGHVNRFWVAYNNSGNDPYGTSDPTGTYGDCTGDYMGTNQDWWNNSDGSTTFFNYTNGSPLYDYSGSESGSPRARDGIHGLKLFFVSRGYTVSTNFNQYIAGYNGNTTGFTYAQYKSYIDSGVPVLIQLQGHTMLGVGYDSSSTTIYVHDTWDYQTHTMTWGGSYSGMTHYAVGVLVLNAPPTYTIAGTVTDTAANPVSGVALSATNTQTPVSDQFVTTAANGTYTLTMPYWWSGTVTPALTSYTFAPVNRSYTNLAANTTAQNYTATSANIPPDHITLTIVGTNVQLAWDAVGTHSYKVYTIEDPVNPVPVDVSAQGTFATNSGRVTWTTSLPASTFKYYQVTMVL